MLFPFIPHTRFSRGRNVRENVPNLHERQTNLKAAHAKLTAAASKGFHRKECRTDGGGGGSSSHLSSSVSQTLKL